MDSKEELRALLDAINEAAGNNFQGHERFHYWDESTPTASLFRYPDKEGAWAVVKLYNSEGGETLYRQELHALHRLRGTRRVCRMLAYSTRHDGRYDEDEFTGPYFIAKEFYPLLLKDALNGRNWFEYLDIAAQQADISRCFMEEGWRDYDGRTVNDAICRDGRLIRLDLDAALPLSLFNIEGKLNYKDLTCFYIKEGEFIKAAVERDNEKIRLFTSYEVSNLAIRLTHMFVGHNDETEFTNLLREMQSAVEARQQPEQSEIVAPGSALATLKESEDAKPEEGGPGVAPPTTSKAQLVKNFARALPRTVLGFFKPRELEVEPDGEASGEVQAQDLAPPHDVYDQAPANGSAVDQESPPPSLERWLALWQKGSPAEIRLSDIERDAEKATLFTGSEYQLLARFAHHLIVEPEHGFDLRDLKSSLLMVTAAFLRDRRKVLHYYELHEGSQLKTFSPNTHLFSLRRALSPSAALNSAGGEAGGVKPNREALGEETAGHSDEAQRLSIKAEIVAAEGRAWKAKDKGQCEDRAVSYPSEEFGQLAFAAVADGASSGGGLAAAKIIERELNERAPLLRPSSPEEAAAALKKMVVEINGLLINAATKAEGDEGSHKPGEPHQAMLVLALVTITDDSCFVTVAHAGDSDCVILYPDGDLLLNTHKKWETTRLGQVENFSDKDFRVETFDLGAYGETRPGVYRIRLFSDGVRKLGIERIRSNEKSGIKELIGEAGDWPGTLHGGIGEDDWSLAGIDVKLEAIAVVTYDEEGQGLEGEAAREAVDEQPLVKLSDLIPAFNKEMFPLSEPAARYWREAMSSWKAHERFTLIKDVVKAEDEVPYLMAKLTSKQKGGAPKPKRQKSLPARLSRRRSPELRPLSPVLQSHSPHCGAGGTFRSRSNGSWSASSSS